MSKIYRGEEATKRVQTILADGGFYPGVIDGIHGGMTDGALLRMRAQALAGADDATITPGAGGDPRLVWGAKLTRAEREKVRHIANDLQASPDHLMRCIAFETGGSFDPAQRNRAGSGATGLIQFVPTTAAPYFYSADALDRMNAQQKRAAGLDATNRLAAMSRLEQLDYVHKYFRPFRGRLNSLPDFYMAILWPAAVGREANYVLWDEKSRPTTFRQNSGLDMNRDGRITKAEAATKVVTFSAGDPHTWPGE